MPKQKSLEIMVINYFSHGHEKTPHGEGLGDYLNLQSEFSH